MNLDSIETWFESLDWRVFVKGWKSRGVDRLLPLQQRMAREILGAREGARSGLMVVAPTSAGKTLIAELAMAVHLKSGRKAVYLVPTRALAEQKRAAFEKWLEPSGLRVVCATRERPETDALVAQGKFHLLVAVYEKMNSYLISSPQIMADVGVVAVDEIQMLGDEERGGVLDLMLTKIRLSAHAVQIVALGAVMRAGDAEQVARWLGCRLIVDHTRPRPLREGVVDAERGTFQYREAGTNEDSLEAFASADELDHWKNRLADASEQWGSVGEDALAQLSVAACLAARGEQSLVFAPTRAASRAWAACLADCGIQIGPARIALASIHQNESERVQEVLRRCLERGVAFHNADLDERHRLIIEAGFNEGEIRMVVCTPTLAMGVNLTGRNVIQCPWRVGSDRTTGRFLQQPLGRSRFSNQGGRAARFGHGEEFGRSIVVARGRIETDRYWRDLIDAEPDAIHPPLFDEFLPNAAVDLIGASQGQTLEALESAIAGTLGGIVHSSEKRDARDPRDARTQMELALETCHKLNLMLRDKALGAWRLTGVGEVVAQHNLPVDAAAMMVQALRKMQASSSSQPLTHRDIFELYLLLALTAPGQCAARRLGVCAAGTLSADAEEWGDAENFEADASDPNAVDKLEVVRRMMQSPGGPNRKELTAICAASMLIDWIGGMETEEFEHQWGVFQGGFARLAEDFQWLMSALASLARAIRKPRAFVGEIQTLAERTGPGIPREGLGLARLRVRGINRGTIGRLLRENICSPISVVEASNNLAAMIGQDLASELESAAANQIRERQKKTTIKDDENQRINSRPQGASKEFRGYSSNRNSVENNQPLIEINLQSPGIIRAMGNEVRLPPLSFDLLAALAERPGEVVTREGLYLRLWPEGGPEEQQLDGHRRRLIECLKPAMGNDVARRFEVVRGIGFRLAVSPEQVRLRQG